ncbi:hypothetical protein PCCS19_07030 [Paenibacillus sp. CCS19]|uniref:RNA helicase n=1 Tax=Paenibacillus sp. CCS19 TaxID=3158387 RepID=UPI00255DE68D|nr:RNA helicase [Paenibacillus cellulosilyticus]GMK37649.1 hypothetical protein PCCS19_07030 [Paenibacillus cellulosilyticus]
MDRLTYYIDHGDGHYEPLLAYRAHDAGIDEMYARQLCTYLIAGGVQYELISNEMNDGEEILLVRPTGSNEPYYDEVNYRGRGIHVEFRKPNERGRLLAAMPYRTHYEVIRLLLKDIVQVSEHGSMLTTSTEVDEDRGCYVIYVRRINEA